MQIKYYRELLHRSGGLSLNYDPISIFRLHNVTRFLSNYNLANATDLKGQI
jgi:hypothetical protein